MFCKKVSSILHHSVSIGVVRPGLRCVVRVTNIIKPFSVNNSPVSFNSAGYRIESWKKCFFKYISVDSTFTPALLSGANSNLRASISFMMPEPKKKEFQRLPKAVQPLHYKLELHPHLENFTFSGKEAVEVQVVKETENIVLNAAELEIQSVSFISGSKKITNCTWELSEEDELCTISFPSVIPVGRGELKISFTGTLNNKMRGFYRSKYLSPTGETRYAAVTQFESTDARRAFPCWDEPALKARFDITLIAPKDRIAISNMPVSSEETFPEDDSLRMVHFQTTPIMSTYLVAVVVGEYDYIEDRSADGVLVRVYTPQGKTEQGRFALEVATKVLPYYKDYFQIAYPLPKIDLITIADFSSGAMENWGLVTYAESALLVDPHNTSASSKQWVAIVVGHELAHQWFGNLVTMEWWTHLWLNEGYASFVEYLCVDHIFPEYDIWTQFVTGTYIDALKLDCLRNSHPIEVPVGHPSEVEEIFDSISYSKGACIVRMLHHYIGEKDFKKGMNIYLTKHKYKNTFTEDLWAALEEASGKPVGAVMCTWTKQMGFPLIKVKSRQEGTSRVLTLSQERFVPDGKLGSGDNMQWMVPLSVCSSHSPSSTVKQFVLETKSAEISLENLGPDDWVKLNPGTVGYYRTQYPPEMLAQMIPAIKSKTLPPLDRLGLLDDLFAITQAGKVSTVEVLRLLRSFMDEDDYTVWSCIHSIVRRISSLLDYTDYKDLFMDYTRELLQTIFSKLGWEPKDEESHVVSMLRPMVIGRLGVSGDQAIIAEARRRFDAHVAGTNLMPADIRNAVYRTVLSVGDAATYEAILKLHSETELQEEKNRLTRSLGSMRSKDLLVRALQFSLTDALRPPDTVFLIASVASSKLGSDLAWQFFKDHSEELLNKYKPGFLLSALVKYVTEDFVTEERAQEVEAFFLEHPMAGTERTIQQSLENIRLSEAWLNRDRDAIKAFLLKQK